MRLYITLYIILIFSFLSNAQENALDKIDDIESKSVLPLDLEPKISVGFGFFQPFGDVRNSSLFLANPFAFNVDVYRKVHKHVDLGFNFLSGNIVGNQNGPDSYLNFRSSINSGSIYTTYNFGNFFSSTPKVHPYVSLGFGVFLFNNKGDLFDENGNRYHYWTDGTIRNVAENSPLAGSAVQIQRDYVFETDLRKQNLDGLGLYPQHAFSFPIGLGIGCYG